MYKRVMALLIGYWSSYAVVNNIPTESYSDFMQWVSRLIFNPFFFVFLAIFMLAGVVAYGIVIRYILKDVKAADNLFWTVLYSLLFLLSEYFLYRMNELLILIILPCSIIYGIISLSQRKVIERRQEGAE